MGKSFCIDKEKFGVSCSAQCYTCKSIDELRKKEEAMGNSEYAKVMIDVNDAIYEERQRQNRLYGEQEHNNGHWLMILVEEVGEVAQAMQQGGTTSKETDADDLYKELIHVAAVASAMAEQVKRGNE